MLISEMRRLLALVALLLPFAAHAQSTPGFTYGQVPTVAQWNAAFQTKMDASAVGVPVGAICNGSTDATAAISAFDATGGGLVPRPVLPATTNYCKTTIPRATFVGPFRGDGRIADSSGNLLGPWYGALSSAPALLGTYSTAQEATSFNYDASHQLLSLDYQVTGAATLGTPVSPAYQLNPQAAPINIFVRSSSGANADTNGNGGRTGLAGIYLSMTNAGQGDNTNFFGIGFANSTKPGATSFLAGPKVGIIGGQVQSGTDGTMICGFCDINLADNSHDVTGIIQNSNLTRNNATGALNTNWIGTHFNSNGSKPIDAFESFNGDTGIGIDLSQITFPNTVLGNLQMTSGGTGYTAGDVLTVAGGTPVEQAYIKVVTVDGSGTILTSGVERAGKYSANPTISNSPTGGTGTGAAFTIQYVPAPAIAMSPDSWIYLNVKNDGLAFGTSFPSTAKMGTTRYGFNSNAGLAGRIQELINNTVVLEKSTTQVTANGAMQIGQQAQLTLAVGELGFAKVTASGSAPGNTGVKESWVCGTAAGSAKKIAYGGTSATPVTIIDNVGSGILGC